VTFAGGGDDFPQQHERGIKQFRFDGSFAKITAMRFIRTQKVFSAFSKPAQK
jgi:hypothetical protein